MKRKVAILAIDMKGGGAERVISTMILNNGTDYEYFLVLFYPFDEYLNIKNIKIITLLEKDSSFFMRTTFFSFFIALYKYYIFCKCNKIEISFSMLRRPNYLNCLLKILGWKGKVIISERTSIKSQLRKKSFRYRIISSLLISNLYKLADKITTNSMGSAEELKIFLKESRKIDVLYNPISMENIESLSISNSFNSDNDFNFIQVARFEPGKNQHLVIKAFYENFRNLQVKLYFLGKGSLLPKCISYVNELNLSDKVIFLGFDNNPYKFIKSSDCMILSSDFEGFPNVILEGLACGIPVISSDCNSGPREILSPNSSPFERINKGFEICDYGILYGLDDPSALGQSMTEVFDNPWRWEGLNSKRAEYMKKYSTENFNSSLNQIFNSNS